MKYLSKSSNALLKIAVACISIGLLSVCLGIVFLQLPWTKAKIRHLVIQTAEKQGTKLSFDSLEGSLPLKWTLKGVSLKVADEEEISVQTLRLKVSILPLFKKEFCISYCTIDKASYTFGSSPYKKNLVASKENIEIPSLAFPWAIRVRSFEIGEFQANNTSAKVSETYAFKGSGLLKKRGKGVNVQGEIASPHLNAQFFVEGNKKTRNFKFSAHADVKSAKALDPFAPLPFDTAFSLRSQLEGPWNTLTTIIYPQLDEKTEDPLKGSLSVVLDKIPMQRLDKVSQVSLISSKFMIFPDRSLEIDSCSIQSEPLLFEGSGFFKEFIYPKKLSFSFSLPHLHFLNPNLNGSLSGNAIFTESSLTGFWESSNLKINQVLYEDAQATVQAVKKEEEENGTASTFWKGSAEVKASHPTLGLNGRALFSLDPKSHLLLNDIIISGPDTLLNGDLKYFFSSEGQVEGALAFQSLELSKFNPFFSDYKFKGDLGANLFFNGNEIQAQALSKNFRMNDLSFGRLQVEAWTNTASPKPQLRLALEGDNFTTAGIAVDSFEFSTFSQKEQWPFTFTASGKLKESFKINSEGIFLNQGKLFELTLKKCKGHVFEKNFTIEKPLFLQLDEDHIKVADCDMRISEGRLQAAADLSSKNSEISIQATRVPIDLLSLFYPHYTFSGESTLDVSIKESGPFLKGHANATLNNWSIYQAKNRTPLKANGNIHIKFNHDYTQIQSKIEASKNQNLVFEGNIPLKASLYPLQASIHKTQPLTFKTNFSAKIEEILKFVNLGGSRAKGLLTGKLFFTKNLEEPSITGEVHIKDGLYENYFSGTLLKEIQGHLVGSGPKIEITSLSAKDSKNGKVSIKGDLDLDKQKKFSLLADLNNLLLLQKDWATALFSGPIKVQGSTLGAEVQGDLKIASANLRIPDNIPSDTPSVPVTYINTPAYLKNQTSEKSFKFPLQYDVKIKAENNIFLEGRGLKSELAGDLHIQNPDGPVKIKGGFQLIKGKFEINNKEFSLTSGELNFSDSPGQSAYLNLTGVLNLSDLLITLTLKGPILSPQLIFESSPPLPVSAIFARILFDKDITELNPTQIFQLANSVATISGIWGKGILESILSTVGIDRFNLISPSGDQGQYGVQIGKYIKKGVLLSVSQKTQNNEGLPVPQIGIEIELNNGFVLQAETQEDQQGKFTLKWNKNY